VEVSPSGGVLVVEFRFEMDEDLGGPCRGVEASAGRGHDDQGALFVWIGGEGCIEELAGFGEGVLVHLRGRELGAGDGGEVMLLASVVRVHP
jgi:hypothetical protein